MSGYPAPKKNKAQKRTTSASADKHARVVGAPSHGTGLPEVSANTFPPSQREPLPDYNAPAKTPSQPPVRHQKDESSKAAKKQKKEEKEQRKNFEKKLTAFQKNMKQWTHDWAQRFGKSNIDDSMNMLMKIEKELHIHKRNLTDILQRNPMNSPSTHYSDDQCASRVTPGRPVTSQNCRSEDNSVERQNEQMKQELETYCHKLEQTIQKEEDKLNDALKSFDQVKNKKDEASLRDDGKYGTEQSSSNTNCLSERINMLLALYRSSQERVKQLESETVKSHISDSNVTQERPKTAANRKSKSNVFEEENSYLKQQLNQYHQHIESLEKHERELELELKNISTSLTRVEREKEEALSRLSEIAGRRLRENNSAIADLSTENRPTKIAEKYKELYDNEWTEAFAEMGKQEISDSDAIAGLLEILKEAYIFCRKHAEHQYRKITAIETYFDLKGDDHSQVATMELSRDAQELAKQFRKSASTTVVSIIQNDFMKNKKKKSTKMGPDTEKYCRKCVEIMWYMSVQLPPMALDDIPLRGDGIDLDRYAYYTRSGELVDFVVWPACMIEKAGALLAKGILQPQHIHSEKYTSSNEDKETKNRKNSRKDKAEEPLHEQITTTL